MQFYKFEGFTTDKKWSEENDDRRVMREKIKKIAIKSDGFNRKLKGKAFFFVTDASDGIVTIGVILKDIKKFEKMLESYLKTIELELEDTCLEETTFDSIQSMLRFADRDNYIDDEDKVLQQYELDKLISGYGRGVEYEESIMEENKKSNIYAEAKNILSNETLIPELNRIYAGKTNSNVEGHPVHYMIQTDDRNIRDNMWRLLLQALYANGRLKSKRYCFVDFRPGKLYSNTVYNCLYKCCFGGAMVVRYQANDDMEDNRATCGRETIQDICEAMTKYSNQVLTIFCLPRECEKSKDIFFENLGNTSFVELKEEFVYTERASDFLKMLAKDNGVRVDKKLFSKLGSNKGYLAPELHGIFDDWFNNKLKTIVYPQYKEIGTVKHEVIKATPKGTAYDELMKMIGLDEAKKVINQALNYYKAQKIFADKGMKTDRPAMHMIFSGNPGTAKTSVARLFARIMKENNLLSKGNLIEVGRGDLIGKYVGWTAPIIQKKFKEAQGSMLFIDEAYSLVDDRDGSFGDEAINTIVQEMENHREDVVVIFAGYPDKMEGFLQKNPGLKSRIAFHVPFADYNTNELCDIANLIAEKKGLNITKEAGEKLASIFENAKREDDFGNGRYVRNIIEKAKMVQATRLLDMEFDDISNTELVTIRAEDIEPPVIKEPTKKRIGFCV